MDWIKWTFVVFIVRSFSVYFIFYFLIIIIRSKIFRFFHLTCELLYEIWKRFEKKKNMKLSRSHVKTLKRKNVMIFCTFKTRLKNNFEWKRTNKYWNNHKKKKRLDKNRSTESPEKKGRRIDCTYSDIRLNQFIINPHLALILVGLIFEAISLCYFVRNKCPFL